ncbi:phytoene/squalene synthase family protein, partial [Butyricicoccus sp. 1XD8-22]
MNDKALQKDAMRVLKDTSRTFYIPITFLQKELKIAVATAYLMMRAIDEIEDNEHVELTNEIKYKLLNDTCGLLEGQVFDEEKYVELVAP